MAKSITQYIPNFITSLNIVSGSIAMILGFTMKDGILYAAYFIILAAIFDFLDGFSARVLNAHSKIGRELDSMADMVSFGVAPGIIMFQLMKTSLGVGMISDLSIVNFLFLFSPVLIIVFTAFRLANFNVDERQTESFIGLASPANAFFIASFALIDHFDPDKLWFKTLLEMETPFWFMLGILGFQMIVLTNQYFLLVVTLVSALLLVANIPMFSFKFKNFKFKDNKIRFIFIIISALLLLTLQVVALPIIITLYILLSVGNNISTKRNNRKLAVQ